ncbi:MAG TPA: hypothetical protein VGB83_11260 [Actinomycetota bacterium]
MRLFRKRAHAEPDEARRAFEHFLADVAAAQRALLTAIPTPRDDGEPFHRALESFAREIGRARGSLDAWKHHASVHDWTRCREALDLATRAVGDAAAGPASHSFEDLNALVGELLAPFESIADVERAARRRR